MTRCMKNEVNLKSSAYNQTGQNYFEQLAAYNSMSSHLRRILLAKSVIDSRNKSYLSRRSRQCELTSDKRTYSRSELTDDVIDRLAYDTRHHPMDVLKMNFSSERLTCCDCDLNQRQSRICTSKTCYDQRGRRQRSMSRSQQTTSPTTTRSPKRKKLTPMLIRDRELKSAQISHVVEPTQCFSRRRKCRYETDSLFVPCPAAILDSPGFKPATLLPLRETSDRSVSSCASRTYDDFNYDTKFDQSAQKKLSSQKEEEEKKYVKFIYDITREIMQNGLYTDNELQSVFKKHIDKNKGILNMNKMLYEVYQLKVSLNMMDEDSETDDELEDLIQAQKLLSVSKIRPPTPPKVLDENKVMAKLESYQKLLETDCKSSSGIKSVVLVDANPELLITERDVLISLIEVGIDPKQAQYICKSLIQKSKDTVLAETVQVGAEASYSSNSQLENRLKKPRIDNEETFVAKTTEIVEAVKKAVCDVEYPGDSSKRLACCSTPNLITEMKETKIKIDSSRRQLACCSTSNLVTEMIGIKVQTDSPEALKDHQVES